MAHGKTTYNDRLWRELRERISGIGKARVKVGVFDDSGPREGGLSMAELAAVHEFGTIDGHIPARSFLRGTFERRRNDMVNMCSRVARMLLNDKIEIEKALEILGAWGAAAVKDTIRKRLTTGPEPQENAPSTIAAKGSSTPLVDTGALINAITWVVGKK